MVLKRNRPKVGLFVPGAFGRGQHLVTSELTLVNLLKHAKDCRVRAGAHKAPALIAMQSDQRGVQQLTNAGTATVTNQNSRSQVNQYSSGSLNTAAQGVSEYLQSP
jgi:hypothetical protein